MPAHDPAADETPPRGTGACDPTFTISARDDEDLIARNRTELTGVEVIQEVAELVARADIDSLDRIQIDCQTHTKPTDAE